MKVKRVAWLAPLIVLPVCGGAILAARAQSGRNTEARASALAPKTAERQFKNIQTLKGIPGDQLIPTMQFMSASLGVECDFCHVQDAFEKDDKKPKQTARQMMAMMFAINQDNFEGHREVTCYSCHRGSTDPVAVPAIPSGEPKEAPEAKTAEGKDNADPAAAELFDRYVQAVGGAAAIDKITSRVAKGTIDFAGKQVPVEVYSKDPDKRVSIMHMPEGDSITAFDGHQGWLGAPGGRPREMHGPDLDGAAIDADLHFATHLQQMFSESQVRGREKLGERDAYLVVGQRQGKPPLRLYFDAQSGLLVRLIRYGETALGRLPTQVDYADYRDVDGLKLPFRWTLARPGGRFTIQLREVSENVPVDDRKFARPGEPPEESKARSK